MTSPVFLYQSPHYVHAGFARSVGASFTAYVDGSPAPLALLRNAMSVPRASLYLSEGLKPSAALALKKTVQRRRFKTVEIVADPIYGWSLHPPPGDSIRWVQSKVDAAIVISEHMAVAYRRFAERVPVRIVPPYISDRLYTLLYKTEPNLGSPTICSVSNWTHKGLGLLLRAFNRVLEDKPDARLIVTGVNPLPPAPIENVKLHTYLPRIESMFKQASVYVQSSHFDPFAVTTLEAMRAGLLTVVTEGVGAKEIVRRASRNLVTDTDSEAIAQAVLTLWEMSEEDKAKLSDKMRSLTHNHTRTRSLSRFRAALIDLISR